MSLKHWPKSERPRERLFENGVEALSDAELLAILLRSGIQGNDVLSFSRELLSLYGGIKGLLALDQHKFKKIKGLGQAKIATLLAAKEISQRMLKRGLTHVNYVHNPESVMSYLMNTLGHHEREIFKILFLNRANRIVAEKDLFHGTVDEVAIHIREVVKSTLDYHATSVILVHNHPSGRIEPSSEDYEITKKLQAALNMISIKVLDHIIIGDHQYFSFNERGLLA